jgi:hypothetical protein
MMFSFFKKKSTPVIPSEFGERELANIRFAMNYAEGKIPEYTNPVKHEFVLLVAKLALSKQGFEVPEQTFNLMHLID